MVKRSWFHIKVTWVGCWGPRHLALVCEAMQLISSASSEFIFYRLQGGFCSKSQSSPGYCSEYHPFLKCEESVVIFKWAPSCIPNSCITCVAFHCVTPQWHGLRYWTSKEEKRKTKSLSWGRDDKELLGKCLQEAAIITLRSARLDSLTRGRQCVRSTEDIDVPYVKSMEGNQTEMVRELVRCVKS